MKQITKSDNIIDIRGASADSSILETSVNTCARFVHNNYGKASLMLSSTMVMQDVKNLLNNRARFQAGNNVAGNAVFDTFGNLDLVYDVFIKEVQNPSPSHLAGRPAAPTQKAAPRAAGTGSRFSAFDAGESVTLSVNRDTAATALKIFLRKKGANSYDDCRYMDTIAVANPGTTTSTNYVDDNSPICRAPLRSSC